MVMEWTSCLAEALPYAAMVTEETLLVGLTTLSKAAMSQGMDRYAFMFYANVLATLILFPLSFIFQRKERPPLTFSLLCKFFFISLIGVTINQNCVYAGLAYSSPTLLSALRNLIPALTFLLAVAFRMEKLNLRTSRSLIKIVGTLVCILGALTITLYKGFPIGTSGEKSSLKSFLEASNLFSALLSTERNWAIGGLCFVTSALCIALWITAQGAIVKEYPAEITIVAFYFLFGTIQSAAVSLVAERNEPSSWTIRPNIELLSVICSMDQETYSKVASVHSVNAFMLYINIVNKHSVYQALIGSVMVFLVDTWCIHRKGPVFVAMFKPLGVAIAAIMGVIFLGETLHVGTIIGSIIIIMGFCGVMWAKSKENEKNGDSKDDFLPSFSKKTALLQNPRDA